MKRPISILCMADLHYEKGNMNAIDRLHVDYRKFVDAKVENQRWNPDYIVIAGDVIDWTSQYNPDKYDNAKKSIDEIVKDFGIKENHVIIVPGNHDNMLSTDVKIKELDHDRAVFESYCNDEKGTIKREFKNAFLPRFEDFITFCEPYNKETQYYDSSVIDKPLQYLGGVRVFDEDHLCFVMVNTEWLYIPKDPFEKHIDPYVSEGISTHMKLYEKCQLCTPLIKDAFQLIKDKYADYTIITVMHRGFEDLTWKENNASDKLNIDSIRYLKHVSDIILSGHDHTIRMEAPTLINNRIQHFRLGSVGRREPKTREYIRTASILRLAPSLGNIEQLNMEYGREQNRWSFKPDKKIYPLFSKYDEINQVNGKNDNYTYIRAKGQTESDIYGAVKCCYESLWDANNFHVVNAEDAVRNGLDALSFGKDNLCDIVVVYYNYNDLSMKESDFLKLGKQLIDNFKEKHISDILNNRLIVIEVIVETPKIDDLDKI